MIYSMTGYASATREVVAAAAGSNGGAGSSIGVSVELRTVNSRFLDLNFRMPEDVRVTEPQLREMLMNKLSRGKVDIRINLNRVEQTANAGALNRDALTQLATLERAVLDIFPDAERMRTGEILRWPGVLAESNVSPEALREAVLACGKQAIADLIDVRAREGAALGKVLIDNVTEMEAIVARITPLVPELIAKHQQKIVERLQDALGIATTDGATSSSVPREEIAERIRQEVTMYGIRIDIAEELQRLTAHLTETRHVLQKGGKVGKRLDFMMQELNREANTLGSKAAAKELADSSMTLKLLIEQMREQVQNLE
ncbi:YicC/YloC family endoribonuclease [Caballeronia sp. BR00000012568055]|uniref:YicC/YloC family endoribonuclease n=1 Tax=Caballeronia sp. BR00000012568055 TaxID=2918761 RepID=UPI0023F63EB3|nr:YicC/YloC family endoribonuclease [Caballeronia sp. BR00000012568055]